MKPHKLIIALCVLSAPAALGQPSTQQRDYTSMLVERLDNLSKALDQQKRVLDMNSSLLQQHQDANSFVFRGSPRNGTANTAAVIDRLLKQQHLDLWSQNSTEIQDLSQKLRDVSAQIKDMPPNVAIDTLNGIIISDRLKDIFSVGKDGRSLSDPPHIRSANDTPKTLGGYIVGPGTSATIDYPAVAEIAYSSQTGASAICTGTLVSPQIVLTAAHCFCLLAKATTYGDCLKKTYKRGVESLKATDPKYVFAYFQDFGPIAIKSAKINPEFIFPKGDLALIELAVPLTNIAPTPINTATSPSRGEIGFIVGYGFHGLLDSAGRPKSKNYDVVGKAGIKTWARVRVGDCVGADKHKNLVCWKYARSAGDDIVGSTCGGDSGGPLLIQIKGAWALAGVTSGGRTDCQPSNDPDDEPFDVDVAKYAQWIATNAAVVAVGPDNKFIIDKSHRVFEGPYHIFVELPDKWSGQFDLSSTVPHLNIAVNATPTVAFLQLDLVPPGGATAACSNRSNDSYVTCQVSGAAPGTWHLTVTGAKPQESQVVGVQR